ncbi:hypothetical protein [Streptomyces sp. NPDC001537]
MTLRFVGIDPNTAGCGSPTVWGEELRCAQNRARLVRALYTRLDRLTELAPAAT